MNCPLFGEVFQKGLAYLALDVFWFFLDCCGRRCILQNLPDCLSGRTAQIHKTKDHAPMVFDVTALALNHRAVHLDGFAGAGVFYFQGEHCPVGGRQLGVKVATLG